MEQLVATKVTKPTLAHPSIRLKGLENGWDPVICTDSECEFSEKVNHMHCPLCPLKVCSQDVAYMKMHFRVKHIDEGVDCEPGFINLKCCSQCRVISHQKERLVRTPHWHCHRCSNISTKKSDLLAHFDSPKNKAKHDISTEIQLIDDINRGMDLLKNEKTLTPTQKYSNKHDVTTQTPNELAGIPKTRTTSTMTEGRLVEEKKNLEEEIHSLMKGKSTMEVTIKHLQKESKRFKEKLLRVTRDNTKLKRQLKILTAIALIPGRNKNSQETPSSGSGSSQSEKTQKSVSNSPLSVPQSHTGTSLATSTSMENRPPTRSLCTPNNHLVRSNINLPVVMTGRTMSLQSPTSANKRSPSTPQLGGLNLQMIPARQSGPTVNAECPVTSKSSVSSHASSVVTQSPVLASVNSISTNCSSTTKNPTSESSTHVQSQSSSGTASCHLVSSNIVIPRNYPSYILTSDFLSLCQLRRENTVTANGNLAVSSLNDRSPITSRCLSSEASLLPGIANGVIDSPKAISPDTESRTGSTTQGIAVESSTNEVTLSRASHANVARPPGSLVPMGIPDAVAPLEAVAEGERGPSTNGGSICENTTLNGSRKSSSSCSTGKPGREPPLSSIRSKEKVTNNNHLLMESSSMLLMNLASQAMERLRNNAAAKRPADPVTSSTQTNKRRCRNKKSNNKRTYFVMSGNSNIGLTARNKSLLNSVRRKSLPSSDSTVVPLSSSSQCEEIREDSSNDVCPSDTELPVSTPISPRAAEPVSTDVTPNMGNGNSRSDGNPQLLSSEVPNEPPVSLSNHTTVALPEVTDDGTVNTSKECDCSVSPPLNVAHSDQWVQTCGEVEPVDRARSVTQDFSLPTGKPNDNTGNCLDSSSSVTKQSSLSNDVSTLLEESGQTNLNLLYPDMELPVPEAPVETVDGGYASRPNNRALKRALANLVEMDFTSLAPDMSAVVDSNPGSPSTSISTPSNEGTSLFSSDGTIDSLLDLHDYDLPCMAESLAPLGREERFNPDDLSDTESFLELCNRFGGGQDFSILDQLPSMLDDRDNRIDFSSFTPQLSSTSSIDLENEQSLLDRDNFLIDLANFWDNNFSLSSLFTLRGEEDNQLLNQKEPVTLPLTSYLQRSYTSTVPADASVTGGGKTDSACGRTSDPGEVKDLQSKPEKKQRAASSSRKAKRKKSKDKRRHRSREKGHKPKKKVCQY